MKVQTSRWPWDMLPREKLVKQKLSGAQTFISHVFMVENEVNHHPISIFSFVFSSKDINLKDLCHHYWSVIRNLKMPEKSKWGEKVKIWDVCETMQYLHGKRLNKNNKIF